MDDENDYPLPLLFTLVFIIITFSVMAFRILLYFYEFPYLVEISKYYDYRLLIKGMENGLVNFYDPVEGNNWFQQDKKFPFYLRFQS